MTSFIIYFLLVFGMSLWIDRGSLKIKSNREPVDELDDWLKKFQWSNRFQYPEKIILPQYKFYSELVELILGLARKLGGNYQSSLAFIREGLKADKQFEKKVSELKWGSYIQMFLIFFLTWGFIGVTLAMLKIKGLFFQLILIGVWQIVGFSLLPISIQYLRNKYFKDISILWKIIYGLSCLSTVPLARSEIFSISQVSLLETIKQPSLQTFVDKILLICQDALKIGKGYETEINYLMEELRFQEKWHFEVFEKRLGGIKLMILSLFFLPAYLSFIFLVLEHLMSLM